MAAVVIDCAAHQAASAVSVSSSRVEMVEASSSKVESSEFDQQVAQGSFDRQRPALCCVSEASAAFQSRTRNARLERRAKVA